MQQAEVTEGPVKVEFDNFEHGFPEGFFTLAAVVLLWQWRQRSRSRVATA